MMSKTHLAIGVASSVAVLGPQSDMALCLAVIGGALGAITPDIDTVRTERKADALTAQMMAIGLTVLLLAANFAARSEISTYVANHHTAAILGGLAYLVLIAIAFLAPHRGFTHSLVAMTAFSWALYFVYPPVVPAYVNGYLSHLLVDLTNKREVPLLFPMKKGFCLRWFYANRLANKLAFGIGTLSAVGLIAYRLAEIHHWIVW